MTESDEKLVVAVADQLTSTGVPPAIERFVFGESTFTLATVEIRFESPTPPLIISSGFDPGHPATETIAAKTVASEPTLATCFIQHLFSRLFGLPPVEDVENYRNPTERRSH